MKLFGPSPELKKAHDTFHSQLLSQIERKKGGGGFAVLELLPPTEGLDEFAKMICGKYRTADAQSRSELCKLISSEEEVFFFENFALRLAKQIRAEIDSNLLELGLEILSLIGDRMDPRDIVTLLQTFMQAADSAGIINASRLFIGAAERSASHVNTSNAGPTNIAELIRGAPAIFETRKSSSRLRP